MRDGQKKKSSPQGFFISNWEKRNTFRKEKGDSNHQKYMDPEDFILQADIQVLGSPD